MSALRSKALLVASLSLGATAAHAGGYTSPVVEPVIAPVVEAAPSDWQGGYAGLTLGYAFKGEDEVGIDQPPRGGGAGTPPSGSPGPAGAQRPGVRGTDQAQADHHQRERVVARMDIEIELAGRALPGDRHDADQAEDEPPRHAARQGGRFVPVVVVMVFRGQGSTPIR